MSKNLDNLDTQDAALEEVGDGLKAWLTSQEDAPAAPEGDTATDGDTGSQEGPTEGPQEPQDEPVEPTLQEDAANSSEAAEEPQDAPQEDAHEEDDLKQAYAALEAKVAELEAREAARVEAQEKTSALNTAGIKGDYGQLLTGSKETWAAQIDLLKQFAAENMPAVSIPRDPAVDADLFSDSKEITAAEFLSGHRDEF